MQNKTILGAVVLVLIIFLAGAYLVSTNSKKLGENLRKLDEFIKSLEVEIQRLSLKTTQFVSVGEAVGYVVEFENGAKFYFAGDTGLSADMKLIIGDYYKPDVAFLPIGNIYTMDPKAAAYAASLINPAKYVIPNHYASFPTLVQDPTEFFTAITNYGLRAKPLKFEVGVEQGVMGIKVLWLGHGAWLFTSPGGAKILVDPAVLYNFSYPEKYKDLTQLGKIDLILFTHGHFEHTTISDLKKWAELYEPVVVAPFELGVWLKDYVTAPIVAINKGSNITKAELLKLGIPEVKVADIGDIKIQMVPATHSSSATPEGLPPRY